MIITGALDIFRLYGMAIYIPETVKEIEDLVHQLQRELEDA